MPNPTNDRLAENTAPAIRAYLGGSFDPVHKGHLQMAMYVYQHLLPIAKQQQRALHVSLLPNARSPFKNESTNPKHRLAMLKLATLNTPLQIDELELWQAPPVYTIDSVRTLRQRYPHDSLIFIMGMDSAQSLDKWKDGMVLTNYVNLWVFNRGEFSSSDDSLFDVTNHLAEKKPAMQTLANLKTQLHAQLPVEMQNKTTDSPAELVALFTRTPTQTQADIGVLKNPHQGNIYIDPRPISAISSTQIRQQLQQLGNQPNIMPSAEAQITSIPSINDIIGNTESNPFAKWLNPAIYQYIIAHQLYSAAQFR